MQQKPLQITDNCSFDQKGFNFFFFFLKKRSNCRDCRISHNYTHSVGVIFSRLIGESNGVGEDGADEDIGARKGDSDDDDDEEEDDEEEMDGSDSVRSQQLFLLFMLLSLSILTSLIM